MSTCLFCNGRTTQPTALTKATALTTASLPVGSARSMQCGPMRPLILPSPRSGITSRSIRTASMRSRNAPIKRLHPRQRSNEGGALPRGSLEFLSATGVGFALATLIGGALIEYAPYPMHLNFWVLFIVLIALFHDR